MSPYDPGLLCDEPTARLRELSGQGGIMDYKNPPDEQFYDNGQVCGYINGTHAATAAAAAPSGRYAQLSQS